MKRKRETKTSYAEAEAVPVQVRRSGRNRVSNIEPDGDTILVESQRDKTVGKSASLRTILDSDPETPKTAAKQTPLISRNADRSARRKSARLLLQQTVNGDISGEEASEDELLAQEILEAEDEEGEEEEEEGNGQFSSTEQQLEELQEAGLLPETPSKRKRGRPKGAMKSRTPSPPPDLPSCERYFFQNRPGGSKTSDNTLSSSALITHEEYFTTIKAFRDPHEPELDFLHGLHGRSVDQWVFELQQGFNICLYGLGSKRDILLEFAQHLDFTFPKGKLIILNGYDQSLTAREIFTTLASTIPELAVPGNRLGSQPSDMLTTIINSLTKDPPPQPTTLLIHSIDGVALRRSATQWLLARLALTPHIRIIASADTPNFPLLWDASLLTDFKWLFHDCTSFQPYDFEVAGGGAGGVVDEVNALLGRSGRKMHGREGVMYVLKSLTQSARGLFALLVAELLSSDEDEGVDARAAELDMAEDDFESTLTPGKAKHASNGKGRQQDGLRAAVEWRSLYQKAVSQFIATNEMSFRGLLKEFHDHEMVVSRKDALGTEMLSVPFRREELETLLEELMMGDA